MRRMGYVRLRDYNLRATANGTLVPISSDLAVPIDLSTPLLSRPEMAAHPSWAPQPPADLAEGTVDGLEPSEQRVSPRWIEARTEPYYSPAAPTPFGSADDELPYRAWSDDDSDPK